MAGFCRRQHYTGRTEPEVLVDRLRPHLLVRQRRAPRPARRSPRSLFAEELRMLNDSPARLRQADRRSCSTEHPDAPIFTSFPGIGPSWPPR